MHGIFACRVGLAKELSLGSRGRGVLVTFAAARGGRADSPCARAAGRTAELWPPGSPRSRRARPVRLFWPGSPGLIVGLAPFLVPRLAPLLLGTETCRGLSRWRLRAALGTACCRNCGEYFGGQPPATSGSSSAPGSVTDQVLGCKCKIPRPNGTVCRSAHPPRASLHRPRLRHRWGGSASWRSRLPSS